MSKSSQLICHCCNAVITAPQYFEGNNYGYTCILKVNPLQKRTKNKSVNVLITKVWHNEKLSTRCVFNAKYNEVNFKHTVFLPKGKTLFSGDYYTINFDILKNIIKR